MARGNSEADSASPGTSVQRYSGGLEAAPSNAELRSMLQRSLTRLENWRLKLETNPNPRMVHTMKNLLAHIESISQIVDAKVSYSYKGLSRQMSILIGEVANLNIAITDSLLEDDLISQDEEKRITASLRTVVQAAVELLRIVQQGFMLRGSSHEFDDYPDLGEDEK